MLWLLLLAIAPSGFLLWYIWRKDTWEPEPLRLVAKVFFLGALSTIPALMLELPFEEGIFAAAVVAPVVEETVKFLVVVLAVYRNPEFDEPMDGVVYAAAAGLGFATVENIFYVLDGGVAVGIVRAVASVPGHFLYSCIWGFALGTAKFRPAAERTGIIAAGLFLAMLLHAAFNFSLEIFDAAGLLLILVVIIPLGWWMTGRNIRIAHADPASAWYRTGAASSGPAQQRTHPPGSPPLPRAHPAPPSAPGPAGASPAAEDPPPDRKSARRFCPACGMPDEYGKRFCANCGKEL